MFTKSQGPAASGVVAYLYIIGTPIEYWNR